MILVGGSRFASNSKAFQSHQRQRCASRDGCYVEMKWLPHDKETELARNSPFHWTGVHLRMVDFRLIGWITGDGSKSLNPPEWVYQNLPKLYVYINNMINFAVPLWHPNVIKLPAIAKFNQHHIDFVGVDLIELREAFKKTPSCANTTEFVVAKLQVSDEKSWCC